MIAIDQDPLGVQARLLPANTTDAVAAVVGAATVTAEWAWALSSVKHTPDGGWSMGADGSLKHAPDGLCLTAQAHGTGGIAPLALEPCAATGTPTATLQ